MLSRDNDNTMAYLLYTQRLQLRKFSDQDAAWLYAMNADPEVMRYTGDKPFKSDGEALRFVQTYDHYERYGFGRWVVERKIDNTPLGWCGLKFNEDVGQVDLGFRFLKEHWNKGFATEAAQQCLEYGFRNLGIQEIIGRSDARNERSIRVLTKIGMTFDKQLLRDGQKWIQYRIKTPTTGGSDHSSKLSQ